MSVYDARFLMATRRTDEVEAEPVTVYVHKGQVFFVLDDGEELVFGEAELREAIGEHISTCTCNACVMARLRKEQAA